MLGSIATDQSLVSIPARGAAGQRRHPRERRTALGPVVCPGATQHRPLCAVAAVAVRTANLKPFVGSGESAPHVASSSARRRAGGVLLRRVPQRNPEGDPAQP
jgi:hypothetical protein